MNSFPLVGYQPPVKNEYIFHLGENDKYELNLKLINDKINIIVKTNLNEENPDIYKNEFTLEDLNKINKCFVVFNIIKDAYIFIKDIFEKKKATINLINDKELNIMFKVKVLTKEEEIIIKLLKVLPDILKEINKLKIENKKIDYRIENIEKFISLMENPKLANNEPNLYEINDNLIYFPSEIITKEDDIILLARKLEGKIKKIESIDLLFRASNDGDNLEKINNTLNGKKNILAVALTSSGRRFAGFTESGYDFSKELEDDINAFLISFDNYKAYDYEKYALSYFMFNENNEKVKIDRVRNSYSAIYDKNYCPFFFQYNANIKIPNNFFSNDCSIEKVEHFGWNRIRELNGNEDIFNIKNLEYFQINRKE